MTICDRVPKLNKCCCCIDLKFGGIVLGVLYLIGSLSLVGSFSYSFTVLDKNDKDYTYFLTGAIIGTVLACFQLLLAIMLLLGICTNRQHLMLPYLWLQFINIVLYFAVGIYQIFFLWQTAVSTFVGALIALYFWMCVQSLYQEMKENSRPRPTPAY